MVKRPVLLLPIGSSGDVNPFLWIGRLLAARGHAVSVVANPVFTETIRALGLRPVPFGDEAEYHEILDHPDIWHPTKGPPIVLRYAGDITERYYEAVAAEIVDSPETTGGGVPPLVLAPATAFGARLAWEKFSFPLVTIHLQPCVLLTVGDTPYFSRGLGWTRHLPAPAKRALFRLVQAWIGREVQPGVARACRAQGVPPPPLAFRDWWQSPDGGVCLWPEWFGPAQPDWPAGTVNSGFPLYDLADHVALSPELEAFLAAGAPPVVFTPGTAMAQAGRFFAAARAACAAHGWRAIFATKFPAQLPPLDASCLHVPYAPFSALLPRCAAIVHHGGIGTTSQALASGIPQLIHPFSHDQPDNAARVKRLGVGDRLWPQELGKLGPRLAALLADAPRRALATAIAARLRAENPADVVLAALAPHLADDR